MVAKRKRSIAAAAPSTAVSAGPVPRGIPRGRRSEIPLPTDIAGQGPQLSRRQSTRTQPSPPTNPNANPDVLDGVSALRASPDAISHDRQEPAPVPKSLKDKNNTGDVDLNGYAGEAKDTSESVENVTSEIFNGQKPSGTGKPMTGSVAVHPSTKPGTTKRKNATRGGSSVNAAGGAALHSSHDAVKVEEEDVGVTIAPDFNEEPDGENEEDEVRDALSRPPPVNSDYLPLPWKGRLGYACLNTYLRNAFIPVFSSRTCRIASIIEHRHPLKDPSQPEHPTKNRPDKDQPADIARGQRYVEQLGLANARDLIKMVRWNDKYGIKFMRLSSEMFPFASHDVYGYKLAPFAAETLAEVGKVVAQLGHRVTTHPGQFTQLGSPRKEVIDAAIRDLDYHDEMLSLLKLPPQQDRDAVMILHLGGAFGDKPATLDRFRQNYARLSDSVKRRLVLENDDVVWSMHELLPLCQELNIPFVLDFHHHNIVFDSSKIREGTKDVMDYFPAIIETWKRKNITPKMHYSEPCPDAITGRSRRKHSPRVKTLPPCPDTMDLMIEAKDKEQAVFELMRTFKLPGFHLFNDVVPHVRQDENRPVKAKPKKAATKGKKKKKTADDDLDALDEKIEDAEEEENAPAVIPDEEVSMGGPENRVYWPPGQEEWLRPPKRVIKKKEEGTSATATTSTPAKKKRKTGASAACANPADDVSIADDEEVVEPVKKPAPKRSGGRSVKKKAPKSVPTPSPSEHEDDDSSALSDLGGDDDEEVVELEDSAPAKAKARAAGRSAPTRQRSGRVGRVSYKEEDAEL
ncbi:UV-endonuclease UvdE, partial [Aaosphaeria arxii CBS 175.79]